MHMADRVDRDGGRRLHERDLGRRLDHAAGVDERLAGDDRAIEAGHLAHVVDDEVPGRVLDGERLPCGQAGAGPGDELEGALVLVPGADVGARPCRLSSTDGTSKNGVMTMVWPDAGTRAAVVRSERHQRMPVKYSREEPASMRQAATFWSRINDWSLREARGALGSGDRQGTRDGFPACACGLRRGQRPSGHEAVRPQRRHRGSSGG